MSIKYRYALSCNNALVDVYTLDSSQRRLGAPYVCLGCATELVPRLGEHRVKHFAHKQEQNCPAETYLHRLAKQAFFETYTHALKSRKPFYLSRRLDVTCNYFEADFGFTCDREHVEKHDLTRYFDRIAVEAPIGKFRADVLLSSSKRTDVILVEFAVTHPCEGEKLDSGYRIIEFNINDESNVEILTRRQISDSDYDHQVEFHNFILQDAPRPVCNGKCEKRINVFLVHPSKKSVLTEAHPQAVRAGSVGGSAIHREILGMASYPYQQRELYKQKVREVHFAGIPIANCFLCKYHGLDGDENAIFCKLHKQSCSSNQAAECDTYRALPSLEAYTQIDADNEEYIQRTFQRRRRWS
jgi:hypothetical protein